MMAVDEALNIAVIHTLSIKHGIAVSEAAEAASILAAEVRRLRDEVNGLTGSLDRAEKALKEAQEQEPAAFWWIGPDGKDNGGPYRGKPSDAAIDKARNMGCEPVLLYARPVPAVTAVAVVQFSDNELDEIHQLAYELGGTENGEYILDGDQLDQVIVKAASLFYKPAVAAPAVPDQFCDVTKLIVPQEWRDVITELADDLSIELDMRYQPRSHYPSELRKYENEMQPVYRARALLQSAPQPSCWCRQCNPSPQTMIVCPTCGNKRCPHANDHRNPCTGSNEPGQPGSAYQTTGDK